MKCAVLDDYQGVALRYGDWERLQGHVQVVVFRDHLESEDELVQRLRDFPIVVLMRERTPLRRALIDKLPNLQLVITTGMVNASVDATALAERGIVFCGTDGVGHSTAELTWGLIISLFRSIPHEDHALRQGRWQTRIGYGLKGKTLGIIGLGRLGSMVAGYGKAFGMDVLGWSRSFNDARAAELGIKRVDKDAIFAQSDVVTLHVNLNDSSRGLVTAADLGRMKPTAYLVNTSRAPVVDQAALLAALKGRKIAGAAIDVFDVEPVTKGHPFFELDNVIVTPHLGYVIEENLRINYQSAVENIRAFLAGKPIRLVKPRS